MTFDAPTATPTSRRSWLAATAAVAATYFYFLIFAEFAFLEFAAASVSPRQLRAVMGLLGAGGVMGAALAAWWFRPDRARQHLRRAFVACALSAMTALAPASVGVAFVAAIAVGLSLGALTVQLSAVLRAAAGARHLGRCVGVGTGVAYACSNLPALFRASASVQTATAALVVAVAAVLPMYFARPTVAPPESERDFRPWGVTTWTVLLLTLVWMDSAAFYVVQHTPTLRAALWSSDAQLWGNAAVHLAVAIGAGVTLDRGRRVWVGATGMAALAVACAMLGGLFPTGAWIGWSYTAGVSLYSTVLVEYPARSGRPRIAAIVFAIAGWIGSALGIGMAQDLQRVPLAFVVAAAAVTLIVLLVRACTLRVAASMVAAVSLAADARSDDTDAVVARGREVYIAEGCIHCHSQFIRPRVAREVLAWGPASVGSSARADSPPLFGSRRQGPDLAQVGNRRTPEWNRLHLIAPAAVSPGSRMPSYAHLFRGDGRGEALVAYLATLGDDSIPERQEQIARWYPSDDRVAPSGDAQRLFARLCIPCHGSAGHGDGPLAARLTLRPPDWSASPWRHVPPQVPPELALARIIKFGLPGLPMAGHEYLPDREVVALARFVRTLHNGQSETACGLQHEDSDRGR